MPVWQATRSAWHAADALGQWLSALFVGAGIRRPRDLPSVAATPLENFRRLFCWLASPLNAGRGRGADVELLERIEACYASADAAAREHMRAELVHRLEDPARDDYGCALRVATLLAVPEARHYLVQALADYCMPPEGPGASERRLPPADLIPLVVEALSRLGSPQDARIFRFVVSRFCVSPMRDETAWRIARRAAVALCRADPSAFERDLPVFFRHDAGVRSAAGRPPAG